VAPVLVAPGAALVVVAVVAGLLRLQGWWQRRLVGSAVELAGAARGGPPLLPDILYFTGESCTICHVAQRPALRRLETMLSDVAIREIDVARDPSSARRYRVMTLPTTVVLDPSGRTVAVNAGYASETALRNQVETARSSVLAVIER
jgi:hypothetical protein